MAHCVILLPVVQENWVLFLVETTGWDFFFSMLDWGSEVPLQSKVKTDCRMKELLLNVLPQCNPNVLQYVGFFPFFVGTLHFLHWTILSCWTDIFLSGSSPQNISHSGSTVQLWGTHTQKIEHFQFGYIIKTKRKYFVLFCIIMFSENTKTGKVCLQTQKEISQRGRLTLSFYLKCDSPQGNRMSCLWM